MNKKNVVTILLFIIGLLIPSITAQEQKFPVTITDDRGKEITLTQAPKKIVVAGLPLYSEILVDLDATSLLVGVVQSSNNDEEIKHLENIGHSLSPSLEKIIFLQPDLILGTFGKTRNFLEQAGIPNILLGHEGGRVQSVEDIFKIIQGIEKITLGTQDRSTKIIQQIKNQIQVVKKSLWKNFSYATVYASPQYPPQIAGKNTTSTEIIGYFGGKNVFHSIDGYQQVSFEVLMIQNPDVIFTDPSQKSFFFDHPILKNLKAVQNKHVFTVKASRWTSSRIHLTLNRITEQLQNNGYVAKTTNEGESKK